jgi:hypothetical protein
VVCPSITSVVGVRYGENDSSLGFSNRLRRRGIEEEEEEERGMEEEEEDERWNEEEEEERGKE